jgi:hypothetical protein
MSLMKRADDVSAFLDRIILAYIGHGPMRIVLDGEMVDTIERLPSNVLEITLVSRRKLHAQVHVLSLDVGDRFGTYSAAQEPQPRDQHFRDVYEGDFSIPPPP